MKVGLYDLAAIACIGPWIGIFGTIIGIVNSFPAMSGPARSTRAAIFISLSRATAFTALGLVVGLIAKRCHEYLSARLRALDLEMETASSGLLNQLSRYPARFAVGPPAQPSERSNFAKPSAEQAEAEERFFRRSFLFSSLALISAWIAQAVLSLALLSASMYVALTFGISCFLIYPFWVRFLKRRPGALIAIGSALCLIWSLAELGLGKHLP